MQDLMVLRDYLRSRFPQPPKPDHKLWYSILPKLTDRTFISGWFINLLKKKDLFYADSLGRVIFPCYKKQGYLAWDPQLDRDYYLYRPLVQTEPIAQNLGSKNFSFSNYEWSVFPEFFPDNGSKFFCGHFVLPGPSQIVILTDHPLEALTLKALFYQETIVASRNTTFDRYLKEILADKYLFLTPGSSPSSSLKVFRQRCEALYYKMPNKSFKLLPLPNNITLSEFLKERLNQSNHLLDKGQKIDNKTFIDHLLIDLTSCSKIDLLNTEGLTLFKAKAQKVKFSNTSTVDKQAKIKPRKNAQTHNSAQSSSLNELSLDYDLEEMAEPIFKTQNFKDLLTRPVKNQLIRKNKPEFNKQVIALKPDSKLRQEPLPGFKNLVASKQEPNHQDDQKNLKSLEEKLPSSPSFSSFRPR
jgi:hypothetical protein